jgi:hypothetical protein
MRIAAVSGPGEADIALHQMQELASVPIVVVIGPLPDGL